MIIHSDTEHSTTIEFYELEPNKKLHQLQTKLTNNQINMKRFMWLAGIGLVLGLIMPILMNANKLATTSMNKGTLIFESILLVLAIFSSIKQRRLVKKIEKLTSSDIKTYSVTIPTSDNNYAYLTGYNIYIPELKAQDTLTTATVLDYMNTVLEQAQAHAELTAQTLISVHKDSPAQLTSLQVAEVLDYYLRAINKLYYHNTYHSIFAAHTAHTTTNIDDTVYPTDVTEIKKMIHDAVVTKTTSINT